jgi:hypothetical protein
LQKWAAFLLLLVEVFALVERMQCVTVALGLVLRYHAWVGLELLLVGGEVLVCYCLFQKVAVRDSDFLSWERARAEGLRVFLTLVAVCPGRKILAC